jgi:hypothetical protein
MSVTKTPLLIKIEKTNNNHEDKVLPNIKTQPVI